MLACCLARAAVLLSLLADPQDEGHWLNQLIERFTELWPRDSYFSYAFFVQSALAVLLASLVCGTVGSLVVGNRMAFFSDALAHCAFAGIALGFLIAFLARMEREQFWQFAMPIMILFGIAIAVGIAFVREKTGLASDTVIGVFFAGAIGFAAMLRKLVRDRQLFVLEDFLFGDPIGIQTEDLVYLLLLVVVTAVVLGFMYNRLVFTSFNVSLARSRRVPARLCNYVFIVLLALIVNVCLRSVGVLLINAMLIVPAATVGNVARNMRQLFWGTIIVCLGVSVFGLWLSTLRFPNPGNPRDPIEFGISGSMVVFSVVLFYLSMLAGPAQRFWHRARQQPTAAAPIGQRTG